MYEATLSKEQQRARTMPNDHSASPLSWGLLKAGKVFVSSSVHHRKGFRRGMAQLPSIPKVVHPQDGGTDLPCQVLACQTLTMIVVKNPIPKREEEGPLDPRPAREEKALAPEALPRARGGASRPSSPRR